MATVPITQIAGAAKAAGFTGPDLVIAVAVAEGESSGQADQATPERDGSTSYGLWQINSVHKDVLAMGSWADPATNARMARTVWQRSGWKAWGAYNNQSYARSLAAAQQAVGNAATPAVPVGDPDPFGDAWGNLGAPGSTLQLPFSLGGIMDPGSAIADLVKLLELPIKALAFVMDPGNWVRIIKVMIGGGLILAGLNIVARPVVQPVVQKAKAAGQKIAKAAEVAAVV